MPILIHHCNKHQYVSGAKVTFIDSVACCFTMKKLFYNNLGSTARVEFLFNNTPERRNLSKIKRVNNIYNPYAEFVRTGSFRFKAFYTSIEQFLVMAWLVFYYPCQQPIICTSFYYGNIVQICRSSDQIVNITQKFIQFILVPGTTISVSWPLWGLQTSSIHTNCLCIACTSYCKCIKDKLFLLTKLNELF